MAVCDDPTDPADMSPEQRVEEVAAILAAGVLRLRRRAALPSPTSAASPDAVLDDLRIPSQN